MACGPRGQLDLSNQVVHVKAGEAIVAGSLGSRRRVASGAASGSCWTISDGVAPGTVAWSHGARAKVRRVHATASDLLLWLYGRIELDIGEVPPDLLTRFGALSFTD